MKNPDPDHELPFLELNEEIPAEWSVETRPTSPSEVSSPEPSRQTPVFQEPRVSARPRPSAFVLTPSGKAMLYAMLGLILLLVLFRVPPAVFFLGIFSVFRVLFLPLALFGFLWFVWQRRR